MGAYLDMIRVISLESSKDINKVVLNIFKTKHHGLHRNKITDMLNTQNVHLMLVDIDALTEKNLKKAGYKVEPQPKISIS